jgi:hypothetical protein
MEMCFIGEEHFFRKKMKKNSHPQTKGVADGCFFHKAAGDCRDGFMRSAFVLRPFLPDAAGFPAKKLGFVQNPPAAPVKIFPCRCQGNAAVFPPEQLYSQLGLQRPYLLRDGRL